MVVGKGKEGWIFIRAGYTVKAGIILSLTGLVSIDFLDAVSR